MDVPADRRFASWARLGQKIPRFHFNAKPGLGSSYCCHLENHDVLPRVLDSNEQQEEAQVRRGYANSLHLS
jgi:hypothetical protein